MPHARAPNSTNPTPRPHRRGASIPIVHATPFFVVTTPWSTQSAALASHGSAAASAGAMASGKNGLVVIVKGTFALVPAGPAEAVPTAQANLPTGDLHYDNNPSKSLRYASDFALQKVRADVTLNGTAHSPKPVEALRVTFQFGHGTTRFERSIAVVGNRFYKKELLGLVATAPEPFATMPLVYERAFGGPEHPTNPVGVGLSPQVGSPLPNLEREGSLLRSGGDRPEPACFGPLPPTWPLRWKKLGTFDATWLEKRWPTLPENFDPTFYQAAPVEQQLPFLTGNEPYSIDRMSPDGARISGTLPGFRVRCLAERRMQQGGGLLEVPLNLDTAAFDTDARTVTLVWRGAFETVDDEGSEIEALFVHHAPLVEPWVDAARLHKICRDAEHQPPAPDAQPEPDKHERRRQNAEEDDPEWARQVAEMREKLGEMFRNAGIDPDKPIPKPDAPSNPAASWFDQLRRAGISEQEIAALQKGLEETNQAAEKSRAESGSAAAPKGDLRALVKAKLAAGESLEKLNLTEADLSEIDFRGASLCGARLVKAKLRGSHLEHSLFTGATLREADLSGAHLQGAQLPFVDLFQAVVDGADFQGANLTGADLGRVRGKGTRFDRAKAPKANLSDGMWEGAVFDGADLKGADFSRTLLTDATFVGVNATELRLFEAQGERSRWDSANLTACRADDVSLKNGSLRGVSAEGSSWEGATLTQATFFGARLQGAGFSRVSAKGVVFSAAELTEATFRRAELTNSQFLKANLFGATFERADLREADMRGANLHGAEFLFSRTEQAQFDLARLSATKLSGQT